MYEKYSLKFTFDFWRCSAYGA